MSGYSMPAILIRRIDYGDNDLILTFFTRDFGKTSAIAKSAKKSVKRFRGVLELFSLLSIVTGAHRGKRLPILKEAVLKEPFAGIRGDLIKTGYASYWVELIAKWMEEGVKQEALFELLRGGLDRLDRGGMSEAVLSMLFQMRFLKISGLSPNFERCAACETPVTAIPETSPAFDLQRGGIVCARCARGVHRRLTVSKGTLKRLEWLAGGDYAKAERVKFPPPAEAEGLKLLETFVPYHLGKELRSLKFLRQIRGEKRGRKVTKVS